MSENVIKALFQRHSFLKISEVAEIAGINKSQLRQYACGLRKPSEKDLKRLENAVRIISEKMLSVRLACLHKK